jgi:drug/metabolite transporter (DMT)-like permease
MKTGYLLLLLLFNVFWAAGLSVYKALAPHLDYAAIVTLRFGLAAAILLALWPLLPGKAPRGRDLGVTLLMGAIVFVLGHRVQVLGNQLGTAGNSSVLMALEPLVASVAAAVFLREHVTARRWCGFGLGLLGVVLLNGAWRADFLWTGLGASLLFVSSFLCEAAYSVMGKPILARAGLSKVLTLALFCGLLLNLTLDGPATLVAARRLPLQGWLLIFYMAVPCTILGYCLWYVVIRESDVNLAALTIFAQPVAGVVIAAVWLREPLHWGQFWGSVAIVAGLTVGLWGSETARDRPAGAPLAVAQD